MSVSQNTSFALWGLSYTLFLTVIITARGNLLVMRRCTLPGYPLFINISHFYYLVYLLLMCCVAGKDKGKGTNNPCSAGLFPPFTFHLKFSSSLSDSVSFVAAMRSCSNVMSCQVCSSSQSYLERKPREPGCGGVGPSLLSAVTVRKSGCFFIWVPLLEKVFNFSSVILVLSNKPSYVLCSVQPHVLRKRRDKARRWSRRSALCSGLSELIVRSCSAPPLVDKSRDSVMIISIEPDLSLT